MEVFSSSDGQRLAAWCFGVALKDQQTVITAVTEFTHDNGIKLLVATITPNTEGALLSVFDVKTSRVLKTIEVPYQVNDLSVHTICFLTQLKVLLTRKIILRFFANKTIYKSHFFFKLIKVTALEGIHSVGDEQLLDSVLSEHLKCFCGVVALGTLHGHVYLLGLYFYVIVYFLNQFTTDSDYIMSHAIDF